jgi:sugar (pentulose or hexulose) kinase
MNPAWLGIDIGTQGARVVAIDETGALVAWATESFPDFAAPEQSPAEWWDSAVRLLTRVTGECHDLGLSPRSLAVSGTSGTIIGLDVDNRPVTPALMYHDPRSNEQADAIATSSGLPLNASWALPKIAWFKETFPERARRVAQWRHPTDVITGRLTGNWQLTDETSALKTGFDPAVGKWHQAALTAAGVREDTLPMVVRSGTVVGPVIASIRGLCDTLVTTGVTDGCASQIASGAVCPGMWNTTIGTTMVIKGTLAEPINDPPARIYNHRHPDGYWFPGAASNTGAGWITVEHRAEDLDRLTAAAIPMVPTDALRYPLHSHGERFPFLALQAQGFATHNLDETTRFAAGLEGVAYLERMSYALFARYAGEPAREIVSTGGGSRNDLWMRIRASVLNRPVGRARHTDGAVGAAVVAAAGVDFASLIDAAAQLTRVDRWFAPEPALAAGYADRYCRFVAALAERGYLTNAGEYL